MVGGVPVELDTTLYLATLDARLVALDARSGAIRWDVAVADPSKGYSFTSAPLAVRDMVVIGRAMPVLAIDVFEEKVSGTANALMEKPFGLMLEALDNLRANEIYVSTGSSPRNALWGELMSIRATQLGARGAIVNGYSRDTRAILELGFPTFSFGAYGQASAPRYKVGDYRVPVEIGAARVNPGDILFGDIDGVCVVPAIIPGEGE